LESHHHHLNWETNVEKIIIAMYENKKAVTLGYKSALIFKPNLLQLKTNCNDITHIFQSLTSRNGPLPLGGGFLQTNICFNLKVVDVAIVNFFDRPIGVNVSDKDVTMKISIETHSSQV
jgi:hypothetical protein